MNQEETLALYAQGQEAWNKWAKERLAEQEELKVAGEWQVDADGEAKNEATESWFEKSNSIFRYSIRDRYKFQSRNFSNLIFPGTVSFRNFQFIDHPSFTRSIFKHKVEFEYATFKGATFTNTIFKGKVSFNNSTFEGKTTFVCTKFHQQTSFETCIFNEDVEFVDTNFLDHVTFEHANFYKLCKFHRCLFSPHIDANFCNTIFHYNAWFGDCEFHGNAIFARLQSKLNLVFRDTTFHRSANFDAIKAEYTFSLEKVTFTKDIPNFIQAHFEESPRLDDVIFDQTIAPGTFWNSITTPITKETKARYQALKRLAIQAHDHENEQRFWAGELRSDRSLKTQDNKWNFRPLFSAYWWGNIAYGALSNYGRSIVRPLIAWIVLTTLVTTLHLYAHIPRKDTCNICESAIHVAVKTGSLGLIQDPSKRIVFVRDYACLYGTHNDKRQTPEIPGYILLAEGFQALISAILIFLFLLGLRNNFKLK